MILFPPARKLVPYDSARELKTEEYNSAVPSKPPAPDQNTTGRPRQRGRPAALLRLPASATATACSRSRCRPIAVHSPTRHHAASLAATSRPLATATLSLALPLPLASAAVPLKPPLPLPSAHAPAPAVAVPLPKSSVTAPPRVFFPRPPVRLIFGISHSACSFGRSISLLDPPARPSAHPDRSSVNRPPRSSVNRPFVRLLTVRPSIPRSSVRPSTVRPSVNHPSVRRPPVCPSLDCPSVKVKVKVSQSSMIAY